MQMGKNIFLYWWVIFHLPVLLLGQLNFTPLSEKAICVFVVKSQIFFPVFLTCVSGPMLVWWITSSHDNQAENKLFSIPFICLWKDPAIATSKRINGTYESYDRGTQAEAWITEADGKTPLLGEVNNDGYKNKIGCIASDSISFLLFCP